MIRVTRKYDGEEVYVNPDWVEVVSPEKGGGARICLGGWDHRGGSLVVRESAAEVAQAIDDDREASR